MGGQVGVTMVKFWYCRKRRSDGDWCSKAPNGQPLHTVEVLAPLALNQEYTLAIDTNRRHRVMKNHTATHLLHAALHNILIPMQPKQDLQRSRIPFALTYHFKPWLQKNCRAIEQQVNEKIWEAMQSKRLKQISILLKKWGATALFGGNTVRRFA